MKKPLLGVLIAHCGGIEGWKACSCTPSTLNEGPHASQRCGWNSGQSRDILFIFLMKSFFASNGSDGVRVPGLVDRFLVGARGLRANVDGTESCE